MPRLNLLPDDCLDLSVVFASVFDERLDGSVEVVGHFTAVEARIGFTVHILLNTIGLPEGADIIDYRGERGSL